MTDTSQRRTSQRSGEARQPWPGGGAEAGRWPSEVADAVGSALVRAAAQLAGLGAVVRRYAVAGGGFAAVTGQDRGEVFSLEARLGDAHRRPGQSVHAVFQVFDWRQPNLALLRVVQRRDDDGTPTEDPALPVYNVELDRRLCKMVVPVCNSALNPLDPTGRKRSQQVSCLHGRVAAQDLLIAAWLGAQQCLRFRREGQLATIWTDFRHPAAQALVLPLQAVLGRRDAHAVPRTTEISRLRVPLSAGTHPARGAGALAVSGTGVLQLGGMSTAVDQGIAIARAYLEQD